MLTEETKLSDGKSTQKLDKTDFEEIADPPEDAIVVEEDQQRTRRDKLFDFLEGNSNSIGSKLYTVFTVTATLYATLLILIFSLPRFFRDPPFPLRVSEWVIMVIFSLDYLARFLLARKKFSWFATPLNILDLVSFAPYWVDMLLFTLFAAWSTNHESAGLAIIRLIRLARIFRVFKVSKYSPLMRTVLQALYESKEGFVLMVILVAILNVITASAVFYAEQSGMTFNTQTHTWYRDDGSVSPIQSIFSGCWWSIITLTTVGYGDIVPNTLEAKLVGSVTVLLGVLVLAFPLSIISSKFYLIYQISQLQEKHQKAFRPVTNVDVREVGTIIQDLEREHEELGTVLLGLQDTINDTIIRMERSAMLIQQLKSLQLEKRIHSAYRSPSRLFE